MGSELFGHKKGAFTNNAKEMQKEGFELANGSTLFLDAIGDISAPLQVKLLRALQEQEFEMADSSKTIKVDVRVVVATSRNLEEIVERGNHKRSKGVRRHTIESCQETGYYGKADRI